MANNMKNVEINIYDAATSIAHLSLSSDDPVEGHVDATLYINGGEGFWTSFHCWNLSKPELWEEYAKGLQTKKYARVCFNPESNGGEALILEGKYDDTGVNLLSVISLQSYCSSAEHMFLHGISIQNAMRVAGEIRLFRLSILS